MLSWSSASVAMASMAPERPCLAWRTMMGTSRSRCGPESPATSLELTRRMSASNARSWGVLLDSMDSSPSPSPSAMSMSIMGSRWSEYTTDTSATPAALPISSTAAKASSASESSASLNGATSALPWICTRARTRREHVCAAAPNSSSPAEPNSRRLEHAAGARLIMAVQASRSASVSVRSSIIMRPGSAKASDSRSAAGAKTVSLAPTTSPSATARFMA
mmetsp:Transcript_26979/g.72493  ORF Transcript_26979/g.72493 Transcript_26979/m.72493 type:complete len:220 (+) Transcript_26979:844-1503(+)